MFGTIREKIDRRKRKKEIANAVAMAGAELSRRWEEGEFDPVYKQVHSDGKCRVYRLSCWFCFEPVNRTHNFCSHCGRKNRTEV